jgi:hypothetical protein
MARTAKQPSPAAQRSKGTDQLAPDGHDDREEQDSRREQDLTGDRDEQDSRREQDLTGDRDGSDSLFWPHDEQDSRREQWQHGERGEPGLRREPRRQPGSAQRTVRAESRRDQLEQPTDWLMPATSTAVDAFAPVLGAWRQIFASWFELANTMVKLQQQAFASMIGAADTNTERTTNGDHRGRDQDALSASRPSSVPPYQIEHARR